MGSTTYRNKTNRISGLVLVALLAVIWFLVDPMYLWGSPADVPPSDRFSPQDAALTTWGFGLAATIGLALFWYPSVEVSEAFVVIRNPIRTIRVPLESIDRVDDSGNYAKIYADGSRFTCAGLETSLAMKMWADESNSTMRATDDLDTRIRGRSSDADVVRKIRSLSSVELGVLVVWVATGVIALVG